MRPATHHRLSASVGNASGSRLTKTHIRMMGMVNNLQPLRRDERPLNHGTDRYEGVGLNGKHEQGATSVGRLAVTAVWGGGPYRQPDLCLHPSPRTLTISVLHSHQLAAQSR